MFISKITLIAGLATILIAGCALFYHKKPNHLTATSGNTTQLGYIPTKHTNVIFDLNDVLFTINKKKALKNLGFFDVVAYLISGNSVESLETKTFEVIKHAYQKEPIHKNLVARHNNKELPPLMCAWLEGTFTCQEALDMVIHTLDTLDKQNYFASKREKRIITKTIFTIFDPETRCSLYKPIKQGIELVKRCKKAGHHVYLLSNMDSELIPLLQQKHPAIFDLFDGTVISADVNAIKPHIDIYNHTLKRYQLDPKKSCFIDDQQENITGAHDAGIQGILCDYKKYKKVTQQLENYLSLSPMQQA